LFIWLATSCIGVFSSAGSTKKPDDMYRIIEHFALGRRRLELFGEDHNIRPGWLTLGKNLSYSNFNKEVDSWTCNFMCCYPKHTRRSFYMTSIIDFSRRHTLGILQTRMGKYGKEAVAETLPQRLLTLL
jgi:hypothetical protein